MPETPLSFANYPRNEPPPGSADRLQALMEGYYGYSPLFVIHVALFIALMALAMAPGDVGGTAAAAGLPALIVGMGLLSYRVNRRVGEGAGWSQIQVVLACVTIALGTVCYGAIGYIVLQQIVAGRIKRFGVRSGFFGVRKKAIKARIEELRAAEAAPR